MQAENRPALPLNSESVVAFSSSQLRFQSSSFDGFMDLTIKVDRTSSLVILVCSGRIVYGPECQQLVDLVTLTLAESQTVGLDFSEVRALDSAGVGALARILTTARRNRKSLVVINPSERVREVLHLTKLDTIFDIFKNHDAAITAFSSGK